MGALENLAKQTQDAAQALANSIDGASSAIASALQDHDFTGARSD
jgi:hypothetical protein